MDVEIKVIAGCAPPRADSHKSPKSRPFLVATRQTYDHLEGSEELTDSQTGMRRGIPRSAMCVQRFDDSLNSAIHITYRNSLRSSSLREPRDPLSKVVFEFVHL